MVSTNTPHTVTPTNPLTRTSTIGTQKLQTWSPEIIGPNSTYNWSRETLTPFKDIAETDQLEEILQQLCTLEHSMNTITKTVQKEVHVAVENKLSTTISNWAKKSKKAFRIHDQQEILIHNAQVSYK